MVLGVVNGSRRGKWFSASMHLLYADSIGSLSTALHVGRQLSNKTLNEAISFSRGRAKVSSPSFEQTMLACRIIYVIVACVALTHHKYTQNDHFGEGGEGKQALVSGHYMHT
jgi:hypothetical protein